MPARWRRSLWSSLSSSARLAERSLRSDADCIALDDLVGGTTLGGRLEELRGRSALIATKDQLAAALTLIELDGIARRLVLCPPDLAREHLPLVMTTADVDAVVSDREATDIGASNIRCFVRYEGKIRSIDCDRSASHETEWILFTSGTTGVPKLVLHTLSSLAGPIAIGGTAAAPVVWSTFYDIRRYGGLQILLRALLTGASLVLSNAQESIGDFLARTGSEGVTHISGTPSHWRRTLMSSSADKLAPGYIRLSGEIADQAILDNLRGFYPQATLVHAFASTEAGVAFEVRDGLAGFPARLIGQRGDDVEMKVEAGSLRIRSARTAVRYLGASSGLLGDEDGFVDTRDLVELQSDRYYFVGRVDGVINVGGLKVHPEEVEAVINRHPSVLMSLVKARANPIMGAVVIADIVVRSTAESGDEKPGTDTLKNDILEACRRALAPYKVPVTIRFVPFLDVSASGKLTRLLRPTSL
jgi:acyl-coenzyme A synthetase/AMP-(fatty) acid ligase